MFNAFGERTHIVPLLAPIDKAGTAVATAFHKINEAHKIQLLVFFGVITSTSADQVPTVTIEASSTNASGSEVQVPFNYRASGVADTTDSWGAITAVAAATGLQPATTDDNKLYILEVDPAVILSLKSDAMWIRLVITPDAGGTVTLVSAIMLLDARYASNSLNSGT